MKWYKHDPAAALEGFIGLSAEERGFYITLIDLCYARAPHGFVTDELVVKAMACNPRSWRAVKKRLVEKGKIWTTPDGNLMAKRVEWTLNEARMRAERRSNRPPSFNKNNDLTKQNPQPESRVKKERASLSPKKAHARRTRSLFPEGWQPAHLPPNQQADFDAFADHARTCARTCADWEAAWRNWHRKSVRMQQQQERPNGRSLLAAIDGAIDFFGGEEAARRYVPGSEGPRPLNLGRNESPPCVRRLPPR
jgi:hypothetical protein